MHLYSTEAMPSSGGTTGGSYLIVPKDFESKARGKTIRVSVIARVDVVNPSGIFGVAYSTSMAGNSGWQTFTPTEAFEVYSFDYAVSAYDERPANFDYVGINSDMSGRGRGIVVSRVQVETIEP